MTEITNAVLAEMIRQLRVEFDYQRSQTNKQIKEIQLEADQNRRLTDEVSYSIKHIRESIDNMGAMMTNFINVTHEQNKKIDEDFSKQNKVLSDQDKKLYNQDKRIDEFVHTDVRKDGKRRFLVSIAQIISGIIIAALTIWATGKI